MGVESRLRQWRKQERKRQKAEMPSTLTPKGLSKALVIATMTEFILAACGPNSQPPEQFSIAFPPFLSNEFQQTLTTIPQELREKINLTSCPPDVTISNAQLASAVIGFDPASGNVTFTITPQQGVEGLVSVTAQLKAVGDSGSCVVAGIATGSAEIDTKATTCTQTSFAQTTAQLVCDGPGTVTADGVTAPIVGGSASVTVQDIDGQTTARVDDGHGNTSEVNVAIGANCTVVGDIKYENEQYEVPVSCDAPANLANDMGSPPVHVQQASEIVDVPVRGGDGAHTTISATRNEFTTYMDYAAPVGNQAPQIFVANIYIRDGQIVLDDLTCQQTALNAPCVVNGTTIPVGTTTDVAAAPAVLGLGGNEVYIDVSDPAGRTSTSSFTQPAYNPFEGVQAFFQTLQKQTLQITISTEGDKTQSIIDIDLSGTQKPPFSENNWLHRILEKQTDGAVECETVKVNQTQWSATCDMPYPRVIGQHGELGMFSMTMTESNGQTQSKPIDVYTLNSVVGVPETLPRPVSPSMAEILVNAGGVLGIMASIAGIGAMGSAALTMMIERARRNNLEDALYILSKPAMSSEFAPADSSENRNAARNYQSWMNEYINGTVHSLGDVILKGKRPIEDIPSWAKEYVREIWRRKQEAITLIHTPRRIKSENTTRPVFNGEVLKDIIVRYSRRDKEEEQFNKRVASLPKDKKKIHEVQITADNDRKNVLRNVWLQDLDTYIDEMTTTHEGVTHVHTAILKGAVPDIATHLLERSEKSWIWNLIREESNSIIPPHKPIKNITRESLVGIICAHLIATDFKQYLRFKDVVKHELKIGKEVGRAQTIELIKAKYVLHSD